MPLVLLERARLLRSPVVYAAIGLPERLVQLRNDAMRRMYAGALRRAHTIVAYAKREADWLRDWLGPQAPGAGAAAGQVGVERRLALGV